jgi:D-sedoheptulose 7-phosphate isomerase
VSFVEDYLAEVVAIAGQLDPARIDELARQIAEVREAGGRLFFLGLGGGAAHASHAVNDFRKLVGVEAYAPTDNVSELTARINDDGWETALTAWLQGSRLSPRDGLVIFSVGGGSPERKVSVNLVHALDYARGVGARIFGIVGRDGGYTGRVADACIVIPTVNPDHVTPHTEAFQAVVWHLLVSHPLLQRHVAKWEALR